MFVPVFICTITFVASAARFTVTVPETVVAVRISPELFKNKNVAFVEEIQVNVYVPAENGPVPSYRAELPGIIIVFAKDDGELLTAIGYTDKDIRFSF